MRVVRAEGDPFQRGRQIGRGMGELIERSLAFYQRYIERRGIASRELQDFLAPFLSAAESRLPGLTAMIKGMAEGGMVPVWELFAVNAFEELDPLLEPAAARASFLERDAGTRLGRPGLGGPHPRSPRPRAADRCSSFTVSGPGFTLLGHNEQWLAGDAGNVGVVLEYPVDGGPALASPSVVCCLPAVGMNEHRGAQAIQSLVAVDDGVGVPRVLVSRHSLEAVDRLDAVHRAALAERAGGYGHVFAFPDDTFIVETSARKHSVLSGSGPHTNHYLDPEVASLAGPPSAGSAARYDRLLTLIEERQPETPEAVMDILRDHDSVPQAICLHADPSAGEEAAAVLFSMVCDVEAGRMWVSPGNPCTVAYEEIDLTGVI